MTVPSTTTKSGPYNGNDVATVFAYAFNIDVNTDLEVILTVTATGVETVQTLTTHYTVSGVGDAGGGNVTMVTPPATGETLTIRRVPALTQLVDLQNQGGLFPETLETAYDKLTKIAQYINEKYIRALKLPVSTDTDVVDPEIPAPVANALIGMWNPTADAIISGPTASEVSNAQGYATAAASSATAAASSATGAQAAQAAAEAAAAGIKWKNSCRCASTADLILSGEQIIDGVTTTTDRVLVKDQTAPAENGIYVSGAGAWTRATDLDAWSEVPSAAVIVEEGTANADKSWIVTSDEGGTIDVTAMVWASFGASGINNLVEDTTPQLGGPLDPNGQQIGWDKGGDIASANPLVIDTDGNYFDVTGTTGFAAMTVAANKLFIIQFDGILTMTHGASLNLPGAANITTAAGDEAICMSTAANTVRVIGYTKADGTAVAGGGKILQVQSVTKTDTFTTTSTLFADITGLSVSITPSSTSSTILVIASLTGHQDIGTAAGGARLVRGSTAIAVGDAAGSRTSTSFTMYTSSGSYAAGEAVTTVDSPATTSAVTYKIQVQNASAGTFYVNRSKADGNSVAGNRLASSIVVMEISGS